MLIEPEAGCGPQLENARAAAARLGTLSKAGEHDPRLAVVDGVVPEYLPKLLNAVGATKAEANAVLVAAHMVAAQCEAVKWAELARSRQTAALVHDMGLPLHDNAGKPVHSGQAVCSHCDRAFTINAKRRSFIDTGYNPSSDFSGYNRYCTCCT